MSNALAPGIANAGANIAQSIEQLSAEHKRAKAYRAMAVDGLGMDPDEVDHMDLPTLEGKFHAISMRAQQEEAAQKQQESMVRQDKMHAEIAKLMAETELAGKDEGINMNFQEDPVTGARFGVGGRSVLPSGINPAKERPPVAEGFVRVSDSKGGWRDVPAPKEADPTLALTRRMKAFTDWEKLISPVEQKLNLAETQLARKDLKPEDRTRHETNAAANRKKLKELLRARPTLEEQPASSGDEDPERKLAEEAIAAGTPREKVAAKYKQRTGKDL